MAKGADYQSKLLYNNKNILVFLLLLIIFVKIKEMIKVADKAKYKIKELLQEEGHSLQNSYVRVGVKSGGCSGLSYVLNFTQKKEEQDKEFEDNSVRILVDKKSFLYIVGTTLEYEGGLNGKGFSFNNPNAQRTCGCGESFAV